MSQAAESRNASSFQNRAPVAELAAHLPNFGMCQLLEIRTAF